MLGFANLKSVLSKIVVFVSIFTFIYIITTENLFETFVPRALCMQGNTKLIVLHFISDTVLFCNYIIMGYLMYNIYKAFKDRPIPFKGFLWLFAIGSILISLTHLMGVLNLFITYYWLDAAVKLAAGWFGLAIAITFMRTVNDIKSIKTPEQYRELADQLKKLQEEFNLTQKSE